MDDLMGCLAPVFVVLFCLLGIFGALNLYAYFITGDFDGETATIRHLIIGLICAAIGIFVAGMCVFMFVAAIITAIQERRSRKKNTKRIGENDGNNQ